MDNTKTGELIRLRRKEKNMTQAELARRLHITDRAVSKWERGLSAPDIALLEPLAEILELSVLELMRGERMPEPPAQEADVKQVLAYSRREVARKLGRTWKKSAALTTLVLAAIAALLGVKVWNSGVLFVLDRCPSPDGEKQLTVYNKAFGDWFEFSCRDAVSLVMVNGETQGHTNITYGNTEYRGLWWAPDGSKYVIAIHYPEKNRDYLALHWLEYHRESNLNAYLSMGVERSELRQYGYASSELRPEIHYEFLQWGADSVSMLIYYTFEDTQQQRHEGYFWYNCETGTVSAVLELEA